MSRPVRRTAMIRSGRVAPHSQPVFETEGAPQWLIT
jgi:hypothetical protein